MAKQSDNPKLEQTYIGLPSTSLPVGPVECLGLTFPSDAERRKYFLEKLAEKLKAPEFRKVEGFPIGEDEEILALSDPPYYTACPNPWLTDFVMHYGRPYNPREKYHREPFAADVSEGKTHPIYLAHSYHTKVPHKAIMRFILHYTEPGDLVLDGFCGTGMTGVAANMCGIASEVTELNYRIQQDGKLSNPEGVLFSAIGPRLTVLADLSPIAAFITNNYNSPISASVFEELSTQLFNFINVQCGWMYVTPHKATPEVIQDCARQLNACKTQQECRQFVAALSLSPKQKEKGHQFTVGRVAYVVWSDVFTCPECGAEVLFSKEAVDAENLSVKKEFNCPSCSVTLNKRRLDRAMNTRFDDILGVMITQIKQVPVMISYSVGKQTFEKKPDAFDLALIEKTESLQVGWWFPTSRMPEGDEARRNDKYGFTHTHHFYTRKALNTLGAAYSFVRDLPTENRAYMIFLVQQAVLGMAKISRYVPTHYSQVNQYLSGTLYVGSQVVDVSLDYVIGGKAKRLLKLLQAYPGKSQTCISSQDSGSLDVPDNSIDYIFVDPPFGGNLMYTALNFFWEDWLRVFTNGSREAVTNGALNKGLSQYQELMLACFREYHRVLKPGRWITVEFSNTQATIWNAIQTTLQEAGFVIAGVAVLDKKQMGFKAIVTPTAVKQDLVISAYKPNGGLEARFAKKAETEEGVWDFVRTHLGNLPVVKPRGGQLEPIVERDPRILFDRTVAFYVRHGIPVPISSPEFQTGLLEKFPERDGMYFLSDQAAEYDKVRMKMEGIGQLTLFVEDERSAVAWLRNYLKNKPCKYHDIQPEFFEQLNQSWKKWETRPELRALLDQYFLCYSGEGDVPPQIHSYLSTNFKELRNLPADHAMLRAKARDRWFVPDPRKNADVEKLREKHLLEEFWSYLPPGYEPATRRKKMETAFLPGMEPMAPKIVKGKRIAIVRTEAVRVGFNFCFGQNDYQTIIAVARNIPENVIQNDEQLQMIYDSAVTRSEGEF
jgi:DNA-directed RNA polymerase subunit RPC12/RpoP